MVQKHQYLVRSLNGPAAKIIYWNIWAEFLGRLGIIETTIRRIIRSTSMFVRVAVNTSEVRKSNQCYIIETHFHLHFTINETSDGIVGKINNISNWEEFGQCHKETLRRVYRTSGKYNSKLYNFGIFAESMLSIRASDFEWKEGYIEQGEN